MKYIVVLGDGMADEPLAALGGKTPLEAANIPACLRRKCRPSFFCGLRSRDEPDERLLRLLSYPYLMKSSCSKYAPSLRRAGRRRS